MPVYDLYQEPEDNEASASQVLGAAFRRETTIGSLASGEEVSRVGRFGHSDLGQAQDEDFLDNLETRYQPYAERFAGTTVESAEILKQNIDAELEDQETLNDAGLLGEFAATGVVQFFDPINYVPVGGAIAKGGGVGRRAYNAGKAALVSTAAQEAVLFNDQETRTAEETAINVGASIVFGAALGGAAGLFGRRTHQAVNEIDNGGVTAPELQPTTANNGIGQSVGAAANTNPLNADDVELASKAQQAVLDATPSILGPNIRIAKSSSPAARAVGLELNENFFQTNAVDSNKLSPAVETNIKVLAGRFEIAKEKALQSSYKEWRAERGISGGINPIQRTRDNVDFSEQVAKALRRGDVDQASPAVTKAANKIRQEVLEPVLKEAQSVGLLPDDITVDTALSYFTRAWNKQALDTNPETFKERLTADFSDTIAREGVREVDLARTRLSAAENEIEQLTRNFGDDAPDELSDAFAAFDDKEEFIGILRDSRKNLSKTQKSGSKNPVLDMFRKAGGVKIGSPLAGELEARGINSKTRPGLFKKNGGISSADNFERDLDDVFADTGGNQIGIDEGLEGGSQFVTPDEVFEALDAELSDNPFRNQSDNLDIEGLSQTVEVMEEMLDVLGLPRNAKVSEVRAALKKPENVKKAEAELKAASIKLTEAENRRTDLSDSEISFYAREAADGVWHTLTGRDGGFEGLVSIAQGPLKGRTLKVRDADYEDFLDNDVYSVLNNYIRQMSAEIEITKKFGSPDMSAIVGKADSGERGSLHIEYDELVQKAGDGTEEAKRLNGERDSIIEAVEASRDRLRGTRLASENGTVAASAVRTVKNYNFVRMLGDVALSSATDPFRVAQVHGMTNFLGPEGMQIIGQSIKALAQDKKLKNFIRDEPELLGIAEVVVNKRLQAIADIEDPFAKTGPIESFSRGMANIGGLLSGIQHWNQMWKQVALQHGVQRIKRISDVGFDNAQPKDKKYLNTLKIGKNDFERISNMFKQHGIQHGRLTEPNTSSWGDLHALSVYRSAMRADGDSVIVTPGVGDKPLFTDHPIGSMAFQFKSFFAGTHQRALMRGMGEDQADFLTGSAAMVAMGMAVYYMKSVSGNFETSDNPGVWIAEGIDRSGVIALYMELNNTIEPLLNRAGAGGVYTGLGSAFGDDGELASRYKHRRGFLGEAAFGPTASTIKDGSRLIEDLLTGNVKEGTVGSAGRLLPFANHPGVKQFLRYYAVPEAKKAVSQ